MPILSLCNSHYNTHVIQHFRIIYVSEIELQKLYGTLEGISTESVHSI
jgi:hypothetical protein